MVWFGNVLLLVMEPYIHDLRLGWHWGKVGRSAFGMPHKEVIYVQSTAHVIKININFKTPWPDTGTEKTVDSGVVLCCVCVCVCATLGTTPYPATGNYASGGLYCLIMASRTLAMEGANNHVSTI
jgi:hypothetical protein